MPSKNVTQTHRTNLLSANVIFTEAFASLLNLKLSVYIQHARIRTHTFNIEY